MSVLNSFLSPFFPDNHVFWILLAEYLLNLFPPLSFFHHSHYLSHDYWKCSEASSLVHFRPFSILPWNYTSVIQILHLTLPLIMAQWFQITYKFNFLNFPCRLFLIWPCLFLTLLLVSLCFEKDPPTHFFIYNSFRNFTVYCFSAIAHIILLPRTYPLNYNLTFTYCLRLSRIIFSRISIHDHKICMSYLISILP